jgi:tetratricopeptide (TPR) repeat protein
VTKLFTFRLSAAFSAISGIVLAFVPLLAVHGVESALVLGILLPPWAAATAASYVERNRNRRGVDLMLQAIGAGLLIWSIPVALLALSSLRIRQCAPGEGFVFMVLGPAVGCALAACVGIWVGGTAKRPRLGPWFAAGIPIGATLVGFWAFYATPTVYVFGVFAGYFPGAIYDDLVRIPSSYLTYRASMVIALMSLAVLFDALWDSSSGGVDLGGRWRSHLGTITVSVVALGFVALSYWHGDQLGHWVSEDYLLERLGKTERGRHCVVHVPRETTHEDVQRLVQDCDFHVERTRRLVGLQSTRPVTAYFFRDQDEKKDLIGVGRTLVSKPWRSEVYLHVGGWPHPILGHEIAHAVLSEVGRGPFAIAATLGGLIPNPGLIEGAATALAWDIREDLDPDQWSRIMLDRKELPAASSVLSIQFSALPPRRAYMAAGSLVRFLIAVRGVQALSDAYRSGEIEGLAELEKEWHAYLREVPVTPHERAVAEVALAQPSIFSAVCPHELAKLRADLWADDAARDDSRAIETCRAILDIDENEAEARAVLIGALARTGRNDEALAELDTLRTWASAPKPIVAEALERYADANWTLGETGEAAALYEELLALPRTDGPARQGEVKRLALTSAPRDQELIYQILVERPSSAIVVHLAEQLAAIRSDGLGPYLEARQLAAEGRFDLALPSLQEAKRLGLPTPRLERELTRLLGMSYFAVGRHTESAAAWKEHGKTGRAASAEAQVWIERIEHARGKTLTPALPGPWSAPPAAP